MSPLRTLFTTVLLIAGAAGSALTPCKTNDQACLDTSANAAYQQIVAGVPELSIQSSDPLHEDLVEGNLSVLKYKFFDSTVKGLSKCKISNTKLDMNNLKLHVDLFCPTLDMRGKYEITGRLIVLPVEGNGDYILITGNYDMKIDCELKKTQGSDGKTHLSVKNYKVKGTALTPIKYDFKNLFNGQKDLSDAVHKFANENWKEVADLVQDPVLYEHVKHLIAGANRMLKTVPIEELTLN